MDIKISHNNNENMKILKDNLFTQCYDLVIRKISHQEKQLLVVYFDTLIEKEWVYDNLIRPLTRSPVDNPQVIEEELLETGSVKRLTDFTQVTEQLTMGDVVIFTHSSDIGLAVNLPGWKLRSVNEPKSEVVVRGPKEGFIESLNINVGLLRRRFRTSDLKTELLTVGQKGKTNLSLIYLDNTVDKDVLNEVRNKLSKIDHDLVFDTSQIEQLIEDRTFSPFPQIVSTERPDTLAIALSQGRVGLMMEGSPEALIMPGLFIDFLHSIEDYYHRFYFSLAIRFLRYIMYGIALILPGLYIAVTTYHQEMIPTPLLISLTSARTGVPLPAVIEALSMEIVFEALREAGIRLPKAVGQAVTIVGALVIGEAAVTAGIVSQPMVIIVALTGIASFTIPGYNAAISARLLRFPIMLLAASTGLFGILVALLILIIHLASLESFGISYLSPINKLSTENLGDILRIPLPYQNAFRRRQNEKKKKNS